MSVFILLALWLPAMRHCELEAAGIWDALSGSEHAACCSADEGCGSDGCDLVEREVTPASSGAVKVPAPQLSDSIELLFIQAIQPVDIDPPPACVEAVERPLEWVPTWHFERRAAQLPLTPSLIQA